jgi:hypothetical protein
MDAVLIILGVLGFGAIVISTYVFTVAARTYVSDDHRKPRRHTDRAAPSQYVARNSTDRRNGRPVTFPLTVNGILIASDRRSVPDRRVANSN